MTLIEAFYPILKDNYDDIPSALLDAVSTWPVAITEDGEPDSIDFENFSVLEVNNESITFIAGGDWQLPTHVVVKKPKERILITSWVIQDETNSRLFSYENEVNDPVKLIEDLYANVENSREGHNLQRRSSVSTRTEWGDLKRETFLKVQRKVEADARKARFDDPEMTTDVTIRRLAKKYKVRQDEIEEMIESSYVLDITVGMEVGGVGHYTFATLGDCSVEYIGD